MATSLDPSKIFEQLAAGYIKLPLIQKIVFPLLVVASVTGIIYVSQWASAPGYRVLFSGLEPADSAAVVERLKDLKIQYELRGDGSTVAITPPEMVNEMRITLASEGIPKGGQVGLEIFDMVKLGTTTLQEKIKLQRAIQGELERTINSIEAVSSSRVHITQPEKSVFANKKNEASASVLIKLRAGGELDRKQVKAIANLVAGSVEGLKLENVTIIDATGNLLTSHDTGTEELGVEATRLQYQREVEKGYVQRVEEMLSKILGPGKGIARVTADMDFSSTEREEETYDSGGQVIRSEKTIVEGAGSATRGGVPGVAANLTNDPNLLAPSSAANENSQRREELKNYEVPRAVSKISSPRGKIIRLSVAVLVDGTYEEAPAAAEGQPPLKTFKPLGSEVIDQIQGLVKSAVGFDAVRGDTLSVENIPFHIPEENFEEELKSQESWNRIYQILNYSFPIVFILGFLLMVVRPLIKFLVTPTEAEVDLTRLLPTGIEELEKELETERQKAGVPTFEPSVDLEQLGELMAENSRMVKEKPAQAALLIRYWLNDGRL